MPFLPPSLLIGYMETPNPDQTQNSLSSYKHLLIPDNLYILLKNHLSANMSKLVYILPLVLLLSLHVSNARQLSLTGKSNGRKSHTIDKDLRSKNLPSPITLTHSEPKGVQAQEEHTAGANELTNTAMGKDLEQTILEKDDKKGGEVEISHLKKATQLEGWKRHVRSTIESSTKEARETADSKESEIVDDVVAMDYAQPHRKPPIHNRKL